jgi:hypothetical protein
MKWSHYLIVAALALAAAASWRFRNAPWVHEFLHPQAVKKLNIEFDNSTVRQYETPSPPDPAKKGNEPLPVGALRKCVRGSDISYTNNPCPAGSKEHALSKGTVTVLSAPPKPVAPPTQAAPEPTLQQKAVERALNQ